MVRQRVVGKDSPLSKWLRSMGKSENGKPPVLPSKDFGLSDLDVLWVWHDYRSVEIHNMIVVEEKVGNDKQTHSQGETLAFLNEFLVDDETPKVKVMNRHFGKREPVKVRMFGLHVLEHNGGLQSCKWNGQSISHDRLLGVFQFRINPFTGQEMS